MPEYVRIYDDRQGSEYVLYNTIHSTSLLYKLTSTYREISVFRTRSKIYDGRVGQIITVFNYFCEKLHHLKFLKSVLSMCRVLNTSEFWIFIIFKKKNRVLNMRWDAIMEGFWIFQDSAYVRFQRMKSLYKILNKPAYSWIMLYGRVLNILGQRFTDF